MNAKVVNEPRRWAAFYTGGIYSLLMNVQGSREDLAGALEHDQLELAKDAARQVVLHCLHAHALLADGLPEDVGDPFNNPFAGLDDDEIANALDAAEGVIRAETVGAALKAAARIDEEIDRLVTALGYAEAPPSIRTPAGVVPAIRTTRELLPLNTSAGLPVLPTDWVGSGDTSREL